MSGAAKSNVLIFLAAACALATVWLAVGAATVVAFRAYRAVIRALDEDERRRT